jgi:hypothetical protein
VSTKTRFCVQCSVALGGEFAIPERHADLWRPMHSNDSFGVSQ